MQQVRVKAYNAVAGDFDYLFELEKQSFEPIFDTEHVIQVPHERGITLSELGIVPPEHLPWFRVTRIQRRDQVDDGPYKAALRELSPQSGTFILMSVRRRERHSVDQ